jgi:hypothetical protein
VGLTCIKDQATGVSSCQRPGAGTTPSAPSQPTSSQQAVISFGSGFPSQSGSLVPGGTLTIKYDVNRVRSTPQENGLPAWGVQGYVRFLPGGKQIEQKAIDFRNYGIPYAIPMVAVVPSDATEVQIWFRNWARNRDDQWDSNNGNNFRFPVKR